MTYSPDPGGNFDSDSHRRVLGSIANPDEDPISFNELMARLDADPHVPLGTTQEEEVLAVVDDLENSDFVAKTDDGYKMTDLGRETLSAPPKEA